MILSEILDWYYRTNLNQEISFRQIDDRTYVIEIKEHSKIKSFTIGKHMINLIVLQYTHEKGLVKQ